MRWRAGVFFSNKTAEVPAPQQFSRVLCLWGWGSSPRPAQDPSRPHPACLPARLARDSSSMGVVHEPLPAASWPRNA